jgi:nitroreductase
MTQIIDALNWRYATKAYDKSKKLSDDQVSMLIEAVRLTPSSYGLPVYKVIHVKDEETREKLKAVAWGQPQITDASDLFVFAVKSDLSDASVDEYAKLIAETRNIPTESLSEFMGMIKGTLNSLSPEHKEAWATRQAYIALGTLLVATAENNIDSTPMEGFDTNKFDEILGLKDLNLKSVVVCVAGYRSENDSYINLKKVRVDSSDLVVEK